MREQRNEPPEVSGHKTINRNIVWDALGAVYGYCPRCGAAGEMRESIDGTGNDRCQNKHRYKSMEALPTSHAAPAVDNKKHPIAKRRGNKR